MHNDDRPFLLHIAQTLFVRLPNVCDTDVTTKVNVIGAWMSGQYAII
jgi:hypothetical protein